MANILDSITVDGVTNKVYERYNLNTTKASHNLTANTNTIVDTITVKKKGLYVFRSHCWFKDATTTGVRAVLAQLKVNGTTNLTVASQRVPNQYGVYVPLVATVYVDVDTTITHEIQSSSACVAETQMACERLFSIS